MMLCMTHAMRIVNVKLKNFCDNQAGKAGRLTLPFRFYIWVRFNFVYI
jgi:hypothetical protein